jgi:hypothetical protein
MEWCINYDKKIVFITINRNAGTTLREFLPKCGFKVIEKPSIDKVMNYSFFAIIRDPVDRWISGVNEYICYTGEEVSEIKQLVKDELSNNNFDFDQHTRPQYKSLTMIEEYNLIKLDDNLSGKINNVINENINFGVLNSVHDRGLDNHHIFCVEMFNVYCKNNEKFYKFYQKDFELYEIAT